MSAPGPSLGSEPSYNVQRRADLLWILEFFVSEILGEANAFLTHILRTSKTSRTWRGPRGWHSLQSQAKPPGQGQGPRNNFKTGVPAQLCLDRKFLIKEKEFLGHIFPLGRLKSP